MFLVVKRFVFLCGVMVCVSQWCNGLCSSVVVVVCVSQWCNGLCFSVF